MTEAEAAFRALKSELTIRPVFHQLERRVKAHVLVAFLGYALWVTLKHDLRRCGSGLSPSQALAQLATLQSADIVLPTTDGQEIRLRRVGTRRPISSGSSINSTSPSPPTSNGTPNVVQTL